MIERLLGGTVVMNSYIRYMEMSAIWNEKYLQLQFDCFCRAQGSQVSAFALQPGIIPTNLTRHYPLVSSLFNLLGRYMWIFGIRSVEQVNPHARHCFVSGIVCCAPARAFRPQYTLHWLCSSLY